MLGGLGVLTFYSPHSLSDRGDKISLRIRLLESTPASPRTFGSFGYGARHGTEVARSKRPRVPRAIAGTASQCPSVFASKQISNHVDNTGGARSGVPISAPKPLRARSMRALTNGKPL